MLVLAFSCYRGTNFVHLYEDEGVFSLRKLPKCWTLKFMQGRWSVIGKCIVSVGSVLLSNSYKIYLYLSFIYHLQMGKGVCVAVLIL